MTTAESMEYRNNLRIHRKPVSRASLNAVAIVSLLAAGSVGAGDWKLTDSSTLSLDYVDRSGADPSSGFVLQATPGITLRGQGGRSQANLSYQMNIAEGFGDTDPRPLSHNLRATGRMEVVEDFFFLGGNAAASLVGDSASSGPVDAINAESDGRQSFAIDITPEFRQHLNRYADIVSFNRLNYVTYSSDSGSTDDDDSTGTTLNLGVRSGRHFGQTNWSLDATQTKTHFDDRTDEITTYNAGVGYRINSTWRVRGNAGYEENDVETRRDDTNGGTWSVGADWSPNPRNSASVDFGERYFGETYSASYRHRSRKTALALSLSHDISNRRAQQFYDALFVGSDPTTGDPVFFRGLAIDQIDEDFLNTQLLATVTFTGKRTALTVAGSVANRDYEVSDQDEDTYLLSADLSRNLGGDLSASLGSTYTQTDSQSSGDSDTYDIRFSLSKRIVSDTSAALTLLHRTRNSSDSADDYTENRIGISLTTSFL